MLWLKNNWILLLIVSTLFVFLVVKSVQTEPYSEDKLNEFPDEIIDESLLEENDVEAGLQDSQDVKKYIDIKGEVTRPGVYSVEGEKRVSDLIELAGGFTAEANKDSVNLAQKVFDEMVILVNKIGEGSMDTTSTGTMETSGKIRINYATKTEIVSLAGIGEVKASAIIQYREEHGHFQSYDDLLNVTGIGEKTLENIRKEIQIP